MIRHCAITLSVWLVATASEAHAQSWPSKPIKVIVTQAAGGAPDVLCRLVMEKVTDGLKQSLIVENRPGAGNIIGMQAAARSEPDGYTFLWSTAAALISNPHTFKTLPYDPLKDFAPVGKIADGPFMILANPNVPAKTLPELFTLAKAKPESLIFATDGAKNFSGMMAAWLNKLAGTQIRQVTYATMPQGIQDTISGQVQLAILAIPVAAPQVAKGNLRALAISAPQAAPGYENVPPVANTFPGFNLQGWMALMAPAGTPTAIVARMNQELDKVLKSPEINKRLSTIGFYTTGAGTPAALTAFIRDEHAVWGKIVREIGLQAE